MTLPLTPPVAPQLARPAKALPDRRRLGFEPKWDGFRAIAFVDGADVYLQSRNGRPLTKLLPRAGLPGRPLRPRRRDRAVRRAGPAGLRRARPADPPRRVAHPHAGRADADALHRLRPAGRGRRRRCSSCPSTSAARGWRSWSRARRPHAVSCSTPPPPRSGSRAPRAWWPRSSTRRYRPGERVGHAEDQARPHDRRRRPGLAARQGGGHRRLADPRPLRRAGELRTVGHTSGFSAKEKRELPARLEPYETGERGMGDPSRWASDRELEWIELRPELVVEITFDHTSNDRIRHGSEDRPLARGQAAGRVPDRPTVGLDDLLVVCERALISSPSARQRCRRSKCSRAVVTSPWCSRPQPASGTSASSRLRADRRQLVLHAGRHARVDVPLDQAVALELAQRRAQHPPRHPVDLPQQLVEPCVPSASRARTTTLHLAASTPTAPWSARSVSSSDTGKVQGGGCWPCSRW